MSVGRVAISWANIKMQLAKCDIMVGFAISSHIYSPIRTSRLKYASSGRKEDATGECG